MDDSKSDSSLALEQWQIFTLRKTLQAIKENLSFAAAEKRGALKVAYVLQKAAYRTTLTQLVKFDNNIKQLCSEGRKNDAEI